MEAPLKETVVMKFGGAGLTSVESIMRIVGHVRRQLNLNPVLVFSAVGKTTVALLNAAILSSEGKTAEAGEIIEDIGRQHLRLWQDMNFHKGQRSGRTG